jgi:hypothetical protein
VQNLRTGLLVFGASPLSITLDALEIALRDDCRSRLRREYAQLQKKLTVLVPQVQRLFLEVATPSRFVQ